MNARAADLRFDALFEHSEVLRALALKLILAAFAAFFAAGLAYVLDPAGNDAFRLYMAVPNGYAATLQAAGVALIERSPGLLANGSVLSWQLVTTPLVMIMLYQLWRKFIPARGLGIVLILLSPIVIATVGNLSRPPAPKRVIAARVGTIADRPGMLSTGTEVSAKVGAENSLGRRQRRWVGDQPYC